MHSNEQPAGAENNPPAEYKDPVIEAYKRGVDRTLLRENLRLTVAERFEQFDRFAALAQEIYASGERRRAAEAQKSPGNQALRTQVQDSR